MYDGCARAFSDVYTMYYRIGMFYFTLGNIRTLYRSKLKSINLLAVVKSKLVSEYSMNYVLQPIISDIKKLVSANHFV